MTIFLPTCAEVTALLTDYEEGALGPFDWLGLKVHLSLCPPCRKFLASLHAPLTLLREAWGEPWEPRAEAALDMALATIREGRVPLGPQYHPEPQDWKGLEGDNTMLRLLLQVHLGQCEFCCRTQDPSLAIQLEGDPISALRPHLPPETDWRWLRHGLGGGALALVMEDPRQGASLCLARLPGGQSFPLHRHLGREQSLVLAGAIQDGPAHLCIGDWFAHGPQDQHSPTADPGSECWSLTRLEGGVRFQGWRGLLGRVG